MANKEATVAGLVDIMASGIRHIIKQNTANYVPVTSVKYSFSDSVYVRFSSRCWGSEINTFGSGWMWGGGKCYKEKNKPVIEHRR